MSDKVVVRIEKATLDYLRSILEPILKVRLTNRDVVKFCIDYFIKTDEAISSALDTLYFEKVKR